MKIKLEGREFEVVANGSFMKRYNEAFQRNALVDIAEANANREPSAIQRLFYACISPKLKMSFDEWVESFRSPFFIFEASEEFLYYLLVETTPTVKLKEGEKTKKKVKKVTTK